MRKVNSVQQLELDEVETPPSPDDAVLVEDNVYEVFEYDFSTYSYAYIYKIYYITDIHLEQQLKEVLDNGKVDYNIINDFLDEKIQEIVLSADEEQGYLLIGGDVGHTQELVTLFYNKLRDIWKGTIISVLGNHELWDKHIPISEDENDIRSVTEIFNSYRKRISCMGWRKQTFVLQNEVLINYKGIEERVISENQILDLTDEYLREIFSKSTLILLGGIGFSGLNQRFNAENGLYSFTVTTIEDDKALSDQFKLIYDKIMRCASDMQVIVLTHTPVYDWLDEPTNPKWIYINGHTHQNSVIRKKDGTTILSDNQIGYKPSMWKLNSFEISGWYDTLKDMPDGVRVITSNEYKDFWNGRGVSVSGCKYPGMIYALKRNNIYMFLHQSATSLCLLDGGRRKRLKNSNLQYYYDNMELYAKKVKEAVMPYQKALTALSKEIENIGGYGRIHGCIVDIDFWNHIYLNPFDGKITPYFAENTNSKLVYIDLPALLQEQIPDLISDFKTAKRNGTIPMLSRYAVEVKSGDKEESPIAIVPQFVVGTEIYKASHIMRSIQYLIENDVIRIWKDEILCADTGNIRLL